MVLPTAWDLVPVHGKYVMTDGTPVTGRITFSPRIDRFVYRPGFITLVGIPITVSLVDGSFQVMLPASDDPDIEGGPFTYAVKEDFRGGTAYDIFVPLSAKTTGIELSIVAPVAPNGTTVSREITRLEFDTVANKVNTFESSATKTSIGLANVDNTSDANKPISTATQTALALKSDTTHSHAGTTYTPSYANVLSGSRFTILYGTGWPASRPSTRTTIYFDLIGGSSAVADPTWMLDGDAREVTS